MKRLAWSVLLVALQACGGTSNRGVVSGSSPGASTGAESEQELEKPHGPGPEEAIADQVGATPSLSSEQPSTREPVPRAPHPLVGRTDLELETMLREDASKLGSISLGGTSSGALFNAVPMPKGPQWKVVNRRETWGTQETVDALARIIGEVNRKFASTQPLYIGDISARKGGYLRPHISHQSGRDVDLGYYYLKPHVWYETANATNLDLPRSWAFVRAMVTETDVQRIFIDRAIQPLLKNYALSIGEDPAWVDRVFGGPLSQERRLIMHEDGHKTHIHVRFFNPIAQETGRRVYRLLVKHKKISPPTYYVKYKVRRGDNLGRIARKFRTTVKVLKRANGLRSSRIYAGRTYKIPRRGGVGKVRPLVLPARRLPPAVATKTVPLDPAQSSPSHTHGAAALPEN